MKKSNILISLFLGGLIVSQVSAGEFEQRIEKNFKVKKGGTLYLDSDKGSVEVRSHAGEEVEVLVFLEADVRSQEQAQDWFDRFDIRFEHRGKDVEIIGEWLDRRSHRRNRLHVRYEIQVPEEYNLDVRTAGGGIKVTDLIGEVELKTSGGGISIGEIDGRVRAETSGGGISLKRSTGEAYIHTSGGGIRLGEIGGSLDAKTSGGSISVDGVNGDLKARSSGGGLRLRNINGNLTAKTSGGSILAELLKQIDKPMDLHTSGGGITLEVPPDFRADIDASTSGGRVYSDLPLTVRGTFGKSSLRGEINGGGKLVTLRSSGGNIEIRER
ncbi:DUF4097 family beta strand repeat protein [candidate division KSB1 bacterium]|nr:DUF4097 family beta strand repeat protein [candidate division KSB1 bacterium]